MIKLFNHLRTQNKLRKFRNNLTRGMTVLIRVSDIEAIETSIIFVSHLERKVVIHTRDHPYESFEISRVFPINPIIN